VALALIYSKSFLSDNGAPKQTLDFDQEMM